MKFGPHSLVRLPLLVLMTTILLIGSARSADAHLMTTGLGPVYDGISHFLLSPDDLIPVLALALLAGLRGAEHSRRVALLLPAAWLIGGLAGLCMMVPPGPDLAWISMLLPGALVAADLRLSVSAIMALAALLGISHGFLNGSGMGATAGAPEALVGIAGTIFALVTVVEAAVVALRSMPVRIGVRVLGSWTAATGILLLGWSLR